MSGLNWSLGKVSKDESWMVGRTPAYPVWGFERSEVRPRFASRRGPHSCKLPTDEHSGQEFS
jgi:hypothetical protein